MQKPSLETIKRTFETPKQKPTLRMKEMDAKMKAIKKQLKIKGKVEPGELISKAKQSKANFKKGVYGLI